MSVTLKSALTSQLAEHLPKLESGLTLVSKTYRIGNGRSGTELDLLARDRAGRYVIIKLNHSRESARQSTHELARQAAMLMRAEQLPAQQIRLMLVAEDWAELIVPFSYQHRHLPHELSGFALYLELGQLVGAEPVRPLPSIAEHDLSPVHQLFRFATESDREIGWARISDHLSSIGADNLLRLDFDIDASQHPLERCAAYLVIGPVAAGDPRTRPLDAFDWADEEAPAGRVLENRALVELRRWAADTELSALSAFESGYPDRLAAMLAPESGWTLRGLHRFGLFIEQAKLLHDAEVLEQLTVSRTGQRVLSTTSSPLLTDSWARLLTRLGESLMGNDTWSSGVLHWLHELSEQRPDATVSVRVRNPCDFMATLAGALERADNGGTNQREPWLRCAEAAGRTGIARTLTGELMWRRQHRMNATRLMRLVYGDPMIYAAQHIMGLTFADDEALLSMLGLEYCLRETIAGGQSSLVTVIDGQLHRRPSDYRSASGEPGWFGYLPLADFLEQHLGDVDGFVRDCRDAAS